MDHVLAVDIGGTKVAAAVVEASGAMVRRAHAPTAGADGEALFEVVAGVAERVRGAAGVTLVGCGIGCGGPMAGGGATVSPLNIPVWDEFPLRDRMAERLDLPTWLDNDAKALALGEAWRGAAQGRRGFLALVVSTGIGGGIVLDGRLLDGDDGNAGHLGHVIVVPGGRTCRCGARGCLEAEASGTAIAAITGRPAAEAGEDVRLRVGMLVGRAVASVANLLDLRLACAAGSVALGYGPAFFTAAQAELDASARLSHSRGARIIPGGLGPDGPLVGAAAVAWRALGHDVGVR